MAYTKEYFSDSAKITEDLAAKLKMAAFPGVDVEAVVAAQRKNIEALADASRTVLAGTGAVGKRQSEIFQEIMSQTAQSLGTLGKVGSPIEIAAKQCEVMKVGFENALRNMRELSEMVSKAQQGAVETIGARVAQSLDELRQAALKSVPAPTMDPKPASAATPANH
jgi:phasin family protein